MVNALAAINVWRKDFNRITDDLGRQQSFRSLDSLFQLLVLIFDLLILFSELHILFGQLSQESRLLSDLLIPWISFWW